MILKRYIDGKRETSTIIGKWKEMGGNETILTIYAEGSFRVISKDGIALNGMYDISHHQQRKVDLTGQKEDGDSAVVSKEKVIQDKVYNWNKIVFTPGENFFTFRIKEEYQFWFNEQGGLVLYDDKSKVTENYERMEQDEDET